MTRALCVCTAAICLARCDGDGPSMPSPPGDAVVTITASGVSPAEVRVPRFGHVSFINNDTRVHAINSDPVQLHTDCPAINDLGEINPGETRRTGTFSVPRICGFHDHLRETDAAFKGRIIVE